jgi:hypothetical protein
VFNRKCEGVFDPLRIGWSITQLPRGLNERVETIQMQIVQATPVEFSEVLVHDTP